MRTLGRRNFLKAVSFGTLSLPAALDPISSGAAATASSPGRVSRPSARPEAPSLDLAPWITPLDHFFVRHHLSVPRLAIDKWILVVEGDVERRLELSYADLLRLPRTTEVVTFECAANLPGGGMVGNAEWTGVPLATLLREAGIKPGAVEVILDGSDFGLDEGEYIPASYSRSVPLEKALASETLLAFQMNGAPLDAEHGYPLRAVVPGWYAMTNVKWLRRIEVTDRPFAGLYMSKRYYTAKRDSITGEFVVTRLREMGVKSQIDRPRNGEVLKSQPYTIRGAAWTGRGRVERVEVSVDEGKTWKEAKLGKERAPSAWVLWEYPWPSPPIGEQSILARAFDDSGETQPASEDLERINRYDNRWIHRVTVKVVGPGGA